jgi:glycosyltransferase involved in cell wall biosynthesis
MPALVSVVIAVRNAERYLAECLDSIVAQTWPHWEIVMVDARSTDATAAIAARYPNLRFLQQTGSGFADAWNCGVQAARGDYVAFIDSDDRWTPRKLEWQVAMLDAQPGLHCAIGKMRFFLEPGETPPAGFRDKVLGADHVAQMPGVLLARPRIFEILGPWGTGWRIASDIDWFVKLKDSGLPVGVVPELLLHKRVHGSNLSLVTASDRIYPDEVLQLLRASIQRKRAAQQAVPR